MMPATSADPPDSADPSLVDVDALRHPSAHADEGASEGATPFISSAYADDMKTSLGTDDDGGVVGELAAVREARKQLSRREEVAVRRGRHVGLSWAEIGTLLGVTKQTMHRKYREVG
jgi:DNA-directed RNA polymerase specialized sigma24 family protein